MDNIDYLAIWDNLSDQQQVAMRSIENSIDAVYYCYEVLERLGLAFLWYTTSSNERQALTVEGKNVLAAFRERRSNQQWEA